MEVDPDGRTTHRIPSQLTVEMLRRELEALKELLNTRLDAAEKATALRLEPAAQIPFETQRLIDHLKELHNERFKSIDKQFAERDIRTQYASVSADQALGAALQAAKELVTAQGEASAAAAVKSETSFTKQIDQIGTIINTLEKALDARITEMKERIDRGEGHDVGSQAATTESRLNVGQLFAAGGLVLTVLAVALSVLFFVVTHK